jgi:hypothetical protein
MDDVPASIRVLLDGPPADARSIAVHADDDATWLATVAALDPRRDGPYRRIVIGIDPGAAIGLAVLADGAVLWVDEVRDPNAVVQRLQSWQPALATLRWEILIGDGAPDIGDALKAAIATRFGDMFVAFVPETASSPTSAQTMSRHTDAAILIAMREPGELR